VLVVGDLSEGAELYDPRLGAWTPTGSLGEKGKAAGGPLAQLPNGDIFSLGTLGSIYSPRLGKWTPERVPAKPDTPGLLLSGVVNLPGGRLLVVGTDKASTQAFVYSPGAAGQKDSASAGQWAKASNPGDPSARPTATLTCGVSGAEVLVAGGSKIKDPVSEATTASADVKLFKPPAVNGADASGGDACRIAASTSPGPSVAKANRSSSTRVGLAAGAAILLLAVALFARKSRRGKQSGDQASG